MVGWKHSTGAPDVAQKTAAEVLSALGPERRMVFEERLDRWWPDIRLGLERLYPHEDVDDLALRLVRMAAEAYRDRDADLHRLDLRRQLTPDWLQRPEMIGYAAYAERFAGGLTAVGERVGYLEELGVRYLHLMPLLQPRDGDNDGGYAVQDYRRVRADLGTIEDLRALTATLRARGVSLVMDLVLNHVAREHEWAQRARAGEARYRRYFHVYPDREIPDAYERTLPEVFPDFAPGNFTFDPDLDGWVWTTFNEWQWDVNWGNPEVLAEYAGVILFLANLGVEVLRLDAIAFMWKRLGTNCQNQPEVHDITQVLRAVARLACPAVAFKAEAIVGPRDLVQYLGVGEHTGKVSDLAYHNSLMVQVWSMLAARDVVLARHALRSLPPTPPQATWICYTRCHDDIGWAIDDRDAGEIGMNGFLHRDFLASWYAGLLPDSWARGLIFQENPATGDRRISGTAASLVGLVPGVGEEAAGDALARLFLIHAIVYGWGGIPVIWSGDELGQPNDPAWASEPGHEDDNRWAHRPRLDPDRLAVRHDPDTVAGKVFLALQQLGQVRAGLPAMHASAEREILPDTDSGVFAVVRRHAVGTVVCVYNVTGQWRPIELGRFHAAGIGSPWNTLGDHGVTAGPDGVVWLSPYAAWWVVDRP